MGDKVAEISEKMHKAYWEKCEQTKTSSGLPTKEVYGPEDIATIDYVRDLGNPGQYPFTRGVYSNMYRGRLWSMRQISGFDTPLDSNERIKYLIEKGETAINIIPDTVSMAGVDPDHPLAQGDVGLMGVPCYTIQDMDNLTMDIAQDKVSFTISGACYPLLSFYFGIAERRGISLSNLRGTLTNDPLQYVAGLSGELGTKFYGPPELALRVAVDVIEFCAEFAPLWNPMNIVCFDMRETGVSAVEEIAFGLAEAREYLRESLKRGTDIDKVAPMIRWNCDVHIDFFEEIAKFRAARRIWSRMMKEEFKAKNPKSWIFKTHVNTSGVPLTRVQPLNNLIRAAYQALAAVLAGVQSMDVMPYQEGLCLPTEEAHMLALRTQQIIAHEIGVARVADPLGGSYYVENLTNSLEEAILKLLGEIENHGGWIAAIRNGWVQLKIRDALYRHQKEIEAGERTIIGINAYTTPEADEDNMELHRPQQESILKHLSLFRELKQSRNQDKVKHALDKLYEVAYSGENIMPATIEAGKALATVAEIRGTVRMAYGQSYDPFGIVEYPFK